MARRKYLSVGDRIRAVGRLVDDACDLSSPEEGWVTRLKQPA